MCMYGRRWRRRRCVGITHTVKGKKLYVGDMCAGDDKMFNLKGYTEWKMLFLMS